MTGEALPSPAALSQAGPSVSSCSQLRGHRVISPPAGRLGPQWSGASSALGGAGLLEGPGMVERLLVTQSPWDQPISPPFLNIRSPHSILE